MKTTFDTAFETVQELVRTFEANKHAYLGPEYPEAQARKDFIDKFFIAIGWDVNHDIQKNPYEQEVKVEPPVAVGATQRHADYAFRLAPHFNNVRFFVEAKKPSAAIATKENYFQVIRYGWNSQTPFAVLTDFQQFHVLDCRYKPDPDTALNRAVATYHYTEYANREKFARIYWLFSHEAVAAESLEKRAAELAKPRGKAVQRGLFPGAYKPVDESFLAELDEFRTDLAMGFKTADPDLDSETLTELAQRTIDRLVFLRFLEDRGIEIQRFVDRFGDRGTVWEDFVATSRRLDGIYNGIVFKQHTILDAPDFRVDDAVFGEICERLASVNTPYDFNSIPLHILGSIYERFLGKVIIATAKRVRVEEKPEVRKAGGVYYTPEYISRYIVANTVGNLIAGRTPAEIATLRFADIACGSGSFLLSIYELLLQHHGSHYNALSKLEKVRAVKRGECTERDGTLYLSLQKKREILLNNIYGVDIDAQAAEVAQLSLYLRLLKDETTVSTHQYLLDFEHVRQMKKLLPDLSKNIVCGNSLIGTDILDGQLFPGDEERRLNPMNFEDAFPKIMKSRKFDAIVGNPPWGADFSGEALAYLRKNYSRVISRMIDSYIYFIDRAMSLVSESGVVGFIVPSTILNQVDAKPVRKLLLERGLTRLVSLGQGIFGAKVLNTSTIFVSGRVRPPETFMVGNLSEVPLEKRPEEITRLTDRPWETWKKQVEADPDMTFFVNQSESIGLLAKLRGLHPALSKSICGSIQRGVSPDVVSAHVVDNAQAGKLRIEPDVLRPSVSGTQIKKYAAWTQDQQIIYTSRSTPIREFPKAFKFLEEHHHLNSCLEVKAGKHPWWCLHRPRDPQIFNSPKFIGLTTARTVELIYDEKDSLYVTDAMYLFSIQPNIDPYALMAVMHSKLFLLLYRLANQGESRVIPQVKASKLEPLPFPKLKKGDEKVSKLTKRCREMLDSKKQLAAAKTDKDKTYYENKCASLDRQIDLIVYDLYDLTEDEIKLVDSTGGHTQAAS